MIPSDLTLRDWFAALVLRAVANDTGYDTESIEKVAAIAYKWADAMLAEREKKK